MQADYRITVLILNHLYVFRRRRLGHMDTGVSDLSQGRAQYTACWVSLKATWIVYGSG